MPCVMVLLYFVDGVRFDMYSATISFLFNWCGWS